MNSESRGLREALTEARSYVLLHTGDALGRSIPQQTRAKAVIARIDAELAAPVDPPEPPELLLQDLRAAFVSLLDGIDHCDLDGMKIAEVAIGSIDSALAAPAIQGHTPKPERCEYCAGQGEVFGKDGYGVPCPHCS